MAVIFVVHGSVCRVFGCGRTIVRPPLPDCFLGGYTIPEFCEVGRDDESTFCAAGTLEDAKPGVAFRRQGFHKNGFA